jgi:hypothetical protein
MNQHEHYQIISSANGDALMVTINNMIAGGWIPAGGIAIDTTNHYSKFKQAMWRPPFPEEIKIVMDNFKDKKAIEK